jgi:hypothetical protein
MKHTRLLHYLDAEGVGPWPLFLRAAFIACVVIAVAAAALTTSSTSPSRSFSPSSICCAWPWRMSGAGRHRACG